ncbi:MAG: MCP four helix bundle domain-containing protein [Magnetococcales bacterium]|nr:MCP four helix bundle domain-containing protein [Magnetococcales bacterium]
MHFSIRTRLYSGFILLLILLLVSFAVATIMLSQLNAQINRVILHDVEKVRMTGVLDQSILEITRAERNIILSEDLDEMLRQSNEIATAHSRLQSALEDLRRLATRDQEREILQKITSAVEELIVNDREVQRLGLLNSNARATHLSETTGLDSLRLAEQVLKILLQRSHGRSEVLLLEMQLLMLRIHRDELHMILVTDEAGMLSDARAMEDNESLLARRQEELESLLTETKDRELLRQFDHHLKTFLSTSRQVRGLTLENGNHLAIRLSQEQGSPILLRLRDLMQSLVVSNTHSILEARRQSDRDHELAMVVMSILLCLSFVSGTMIAWRISRDVNRGLAEAIHTVEAVARGDLDNEVVQASEKNRDEFAQLRQAMRCLVETESRVAEMAQRLAREDLSVTVAPRSPCDRLLMAMADLAVALRERAELRRMLLVAEKMSSIGQFAVRVAHEINNPLSTAAMGLQNVRLLLPRHHLDDALMRRLNQVENNIERATLVARQMLEYSWTGQPECADFLLQDELADVFELVQADGRPVEIQLLMDGPMELWGDRMKIGQVLRNLIQNALDATPDHGVVRVNADREGERVVVRIRDWGSGLAPDVEGKIFEPFFTTKQAGIGIGLGLPICYSITRQHCGTLEVVNAEGGGVLATLRLPVTSAHQLA